MKKGRQVDEIQKVDDEMCKKFVKTMFTLFNLSNVPRSGYIVAASIPLCMVPNVASHTLFVSYVSLFIAEYLRHECNFKINIEKILTMALFHDAHESILLDLPDGPTYRSILLGDDTNTCGMREVEKRAQDKFLSLLPNFVKQGIMMAMSRYLSRDTLEAMIVDIADRIVNLLEVIQLVRCGFKHPWLDAIWQVKVKEINTTLNKIDIKQMREFILTFVRILESVKKNPTSYPYLQSPYLNRDSLDLSQ